MHLAVGQRTDELTVLADVRNQHRQLRMLKLRCLVAGPRWPAALLQDAEMPCEPDLLVLGQRLISEHNNEVLMPDLDNLGDRFRGQILAEVYIDDFGA